MAKCYNRNDAGYQALRGVFKSDIETSQIINNWQEVNNTDIFPTTVQAQTMIKDQKVNFALKQKDFGEAVLDNMRREKIGSRLFGQFLINNSNPNTELYDEAYLENNLKKFYRYLEINNIPVKSFKVTKTDKSYKVEALFNSFTPKDIIEKSRSWDTNRSRAVVMHLKKMFPQVQIKMLSPTQARVVYEKIPKWRKKNVGFNEINSFYRNGVAYLIKGRVTDEIAIEEILHPFTDAIKIENEELFNSLLEESTKNFPVLAQQITDAYNQQTRDFSVIERDLEIVTQALARHFKNEYETTPTKSFLEKIASVLEWFKGIIKNLNKYLTGKPLPVSAINAKTSLSDVAKLLNTEGIQFKLEKRVDGNVRYSLTPEKQKQLNAALAKANPSQRPVILQMFNVAQLENGTIIDKLSVSEKNAGEGAPLVTLIDETHTYIDVNDQKKVFTSATTAVKGVMDEQMQYEHKLNLDIGNEVDTLLEGVIANLDFETSYAALATDNISKESAKNVFDVLYNVIDQFRTDKEMIILSQVVLHDKDLAGMVDIFIIDKHGKVRIMDLKTSKNALDSTKPVNDKAGKRIANKYKGIDYTLGPDSKLRAMGVTKLSTEGQHNMQVNLYRRMAENMGYEVAYDKWAVSTLHFTVGVTGEKLNQVFDGTIRYDDHIPHPISQNADMVEFLLPSAKNTAKANKIKDQQKDTFNETFKGKDEVHNVTEEDKKVAEDFTEYNFIAGLLTDYQAALIKKRDMIPLLKNSIYVSSTEENEIDQISKLIAYINIALADGPAGQSIALSELLQDALKQIKDFRAFMENPKNINSKEYVSYALHFDKYLQTFHNLYVLEDLKGLNNTQKNLILSLQTQLHKLSGANDGSYGIVGQALSDYVMEQTRLKSNNEFGAEGSFYTIEDLQKLMVTAQDISVVKLQTSDMDTSPDVLLATMAKIRKAQNQKLLDKVAQRERLIRQAAQRLVKLSPESNLQDLYDFMLQFEDGVFTGRYVTVVGSQYDLLQEKFRNPLSDNKGVWYQYRPITDKKNASKEDLDWNINLAEKKAAFGKFFRAEQKNERGELVKGTYHEYTQEFMDARNEFEFWSPGTETNEIGYWQKRDTKTTAEFAAYEAKYYEGKEYIIAKKESGRYTGEIQEEVGGSVFPKVKYRKVRLDTSDPLNPNMRSKKYIEIMKGTDAKSVAERDFYNLYVDMFENDLLKKIPIGQAADMLGKVPLVENRLVENLKSKDSAFIKMFSKAVRPASWNMFQTTQVQKNVSLDNQGNIINQLPVYFTGSPKDDKAMEEVQKDIDFLKTQYKNNDIADVEYRKKIALLQGEMVKLRSKPSLGNISKDMASSLIKFSYMAENYETMGQIDDTLNAFVKIIERRTYTPSPDKATDYVANKANYARGKVGDLKEKLVTKEIIGTKANSAMPEKNVVLRAKRFMSMIHYDNELMTKGAMDKIASGIIQFSSLSYVAFNPFGNFNNYLIGRINNNIEAIGGRFYSQKNFQRATWEFNKRALPSLVQRTAHGGAEDLLDVVTLGIIPGLAKADYNKKLPNSKYEAFVDMFRMMDSMSDIREQSSATDGKSWFDRAAEWGYIMQDAAEYNSQTKVGMAILMDTMLKNTDENSSEYGQTLSFFDAFDFDAKTNKNVRKAGYDAIIYNGVEQEYTDDIRFDIRNKIREVNKQIHGNYAKEDRMVMQQHTIGNLAVQFKKWVAPAIRARYQREYFDQNLGWMEGRYKSALSFVNYAMKEVIKGNTDLKNMGKSYLDAQVNSYSQEKYGVERTYGQGGNMDQRAKNKLFGFYRSMGELGVMFSVLFMSMLFDEILTGDDDDSDTMKRWKNLTRYQADRAYKELVLFMPSFAGAKQIDQMANSPIASARSVTEMAEFLEMFIVGNARYGLSVVTGNEEKFMANSTYVYQRGDRKGVFKVHKNMRDVFPIFYSIQKWKSYIKNADFYIK